MSHPGGFGRAAATAQIYRDLAFSHGLPAKQIAAIIIEYESLQLEMANIEEEQRLGPSALGRLQDDMIKDDQVQDFNSGIEAAANIAHHHYMVAANDPERFHEKDIAEEIRDEIRALAIQMDDMESPIYAGVQEGQRAATEIQCLDCGMNYSKQPMDVVLSKEQWLLLNPKDGGVLCAACIVKRAAKLPNAVTIAARIAFAGDYDKFEGPLDPEKFVP